MDAWVGRPVLSYAVPVMHRALVEDDPDIVELVTRVVGLEIGAGDCALKPFSPKELVAFVHAAKSLGYRLAEDDQ